MSKIEQLKKAIAVLESPHVSTVEISYEYEADSIRHYTAITHRRGEQHRYTVRVQDWFEAGEKQTWAKCTCAASGRAMVCRHVLAVSAIDAERFDRDMYLGVFSDYKARGICAGCQPARVAGGLE